MKVKKVAGFDHEPSETIKVIDLGKEGESVQVWGKSPDNRDVIILSYERDHNGPKNVETTEFPKEGKYFKIIKDDKSICYFKGRHAKPTRSEIELSSGRILIEDEEEGFEVETVWTEKFDFKNKKPIGRKLGDRKIIQLHKDNREYFVTTSQKQNNETIWLLVEKFQGTELKEETIIEL